MRRIVWLVGLRPCLNASDSKTKCLTGLWLLFALSCSSAPALASEAFVQAPIPAISRRVLLTFDDIPSQIIKGGAPTVSAAAERLHVNELVADALPAVLNRLASDGWTFVDAATTLADPAYALEERDPGVKTHLELTDTPEG